MNPQRIVYLGLILVGLGVSICAIDPLEATALCYEVEDGFVTGLYECQTNLGEWFNIQPTRHIESSQQSLDKGNAK